MSPSLVFLVLDDEQNFRRRFTALADWRLWWWISTKSPIRCTMLLAVGIDGTMFKVVINC